MRRFRFSFAVRLSEVEPWVCKCSLNSRFSSEVSKVAASDDTCVGSNGVLVSCDIPDGTSLSSSES